MLNNWLFFLFVTSYTVVASQDSEEVCSEILQLSCQIEGFKTCPTITYHFPRNNQTEDYVRYRGYFPRLKEGTVCAWVESKGHLALNGFATIISYSTSVSYNSFYLGIKNDTTVRYVIMEKRRRATVMNLKEGEKFHICMWFSPQQGGIYLNGESVSSSSLNITLIPGGGSMILGQEQDAEDAGGLNPQQAFNGNISNLMIWPRVLTGEEINRIVHNCECPVDYSVVMSLDRTEMYGEASYSVPSLCPTRGN